MQNERPRKLQRISQACDLCHRRSIRCRPSNEDAERCQNCYDFDVSCTYDRPSKRRKHPQAPILPRESPQTVAAASSSRAPLLQTSYGGMPDFVDAAQNVGHVIAYLMTQTDREKPGKDVDPNTFVALHGGEIDELDVSWKAFALSCESVVLELFDIYMQIVFPLFPLFHEPTEKKRLRKREHLKDRGFFASIMAACALVSARIRDGAYSKPVSDSLRRPGVSSEIFFSAAKKSFTTDFDKMTGADYIRASTLLSLTCVHYGYSADVQQYLGMAYTLTSMHKFYDERYWPSDLDKLQREVYRRVYWCTYNLDVYSAIVWNTFFRSQEIHANVRYPSDDEEYSEFHVARPGTQQLPSWLVGWNFTTNLYRVLEHVTNKARAKKFRRDDRPSVDSLVFQDTFDDKNVMQSMLNMYYELPNLFKETPAMTGDNRIDIYGFQAANIQATLQLLRMLLFSFEDGPGTERKCDVASEVLEVFHSIPVTYLRAISTPLIYQLGSIGQILGSVFEVPLTQAVYERVRAAVVLMADLLENLESALHRSAGAAQGLRAQVKKIDDYMRTQRKPEPQPATASSTRNADYADVPVTSSTGLLVHDVSGGFDNIQIPPEFQTEWPWQFFQGGNYFTGTYGP